MKIDYLFFDLDGTLIDSEEGILNAVRYALEKFHFSPIPPREDLLFFIGPPLSDSFMKLCGVPYEESLRIVDCYRDYYRSRGIFECRVYDGIVDLLEQVTKAGDHAVLATSKPTAFAERIIEHVGLGKYITHIFGPEFDGTRGKKEEVIAYGAEQLGIGAERIVMIGDRNFDVIGAGKNGTDFCGALWGFGSMEELCDAGAKAEKCFARPGDLKEYLLRLQSEN